MLLGFAVGLGGGLYVNLTGQAVIPEVMEIIQAVGQIFLRLLFMLVLPLLFAALAVGVAEMGDLKSLGRVGYKTLMFTILVSAIAVGIGLGMVNLFRPGDGVDPVLAQQLLDQGREGATAIVGNAPKSIEAGQFFLDMIPSNVVTAAAENQILPVMVFALIFGIGMVMAKSRATDQLQETLQGVFEVMMKLINLVIKLAPIAIAALMFNLAAVFGWDLLIRLGAYAAVALGAMARVAFRTGQYMDARAFSQRALAAGGVDPAALLLASQIEQKLGDTAASARYVRRLRDEFPDAVPGVPGDTTQR